MKHAFVTRNTEPHKCFDYHGKVFIPVCENLHFSQCCAACTESVVCSLMLPCDTTELLHPLDQHARRARPGFRPVAQQAQQPLKPVVKAAVQEAHARTTCYKHATANIAGLVHT